VLLLVRFVDELIVFIPAGTLPQIADDFHLSYAQAGLLLAMLSAGGLFGSVLAVAADHVSRRALASGGAAVVALCLLVFGISPWFAGLLLSALVWGAAGDAVSSGAEVALVDVSGRHLTAALGRQNFLGALGDLLSPIVLVVAGLAHLGWRVLFVGSAVLMGDEPFLAFLILFLERVQRVPVSVAALAALANLAGSAVGSFFAPRLLQRRYRVWLVASGFGLPLAIVLLVAVPILPVQYLAAAFGGVCGALVWVAVQALSLGLRPGQPGTTSAVISLIALPALGFPVLVGLVADHAGLGAAMALYALVTLAAGFLLVPLSRLRRVPATSMDGHQAPEVP